MDPVRVWGLVFLATGVLAILDTTGVVAWSQTFVAIPFPRPREEQADPSVTPALQP